MDQKDRFITYFREVQPKFSRIYATILEKANLTLPQYALLNELVIVGTVPMTEASKKLHISKPAVTSLVDRLEKAKYIKRIAHPKDRRVYLLQIQPHGEKVVHEAQSHILRILLKTLSGFSAAEKATVNKFYASLSHTLSDFFENSKKYTK